MWNNVVILVKCPTSCRGVHIYYTPSLRQQHSMIWYVAVREDKNPCMLTIVSTMFGLELRSVLAAKKTSTMLWWRIISRIMVQAQKVPLLPPPFLLQKERTQKHTDHKQKDMSDLIKTRQSNSDSLSKGEAQSEMSQFDWAQIKHAVRKRPTGRLSRWISE